MMIPDVNLLLYAYDLSSPQHQVARSWWEGALGGQEPVGLAWATVLGFIRIGTHPRVFKRPLSIDDATAEVEAWFGQGVVQALSPGPRHLTILTNLLRKTRSFANLTTDAHLAALSIEFGGTVVSSDADFRRFPGVQYENPLES